MAIAFVGHAAAAADTLLLSAVTGAPEVGHFAIVYAEDGAGTVSPVLPSGWTNIDINNRGSYRSRVGYRFIEFGDVDIGVWTGADRIQVSVYSGVDPDDPIGVTNKASANGTTITFMGLTADDLSGKSWLVGFYGHQTGPNVHSIALTGATIRSTGHGVPTIGSADIANVTGVVGNITSAGVGGSGDNLTQTVELHSLLGVPPTPTSYLYEIVSGALPTGLSLNSSTGEITGTPSVSGVFEFEFRVSNNYLSSATFSCSMAVYPGPFQIGEGYPEATYSINIERLITRQEQVWHRNTRIMTRPALVRGTDIIYMDESEFTQLIDLDILDADGYWTSPTLNKGNRKAEYTITRVVIRYESAVSSSIVIEASGDGGETWESGFTTPVLLRPTGGKILRAVQGFNVTGMDVRFRVELPSDALVRLHEWSAEVILRDQVKPDHG